MDEKKFHGRVLGVVLLLLGLFVAFIFLLYHLQVVNGDYYKARTVKAIGKTETVAASRGDTLDRYGRTLITNTVVYQVTLDTAVMGDRRNAVLLQLTQLAQTEGVTWTDNLPLSKTVPITDTLGSLSDTARNNYTALTGKLGWKSTQGPALLAELRQYYKIDESLSDEDARQVVGILYELSLRTQDIIWSGYVFASGVTIDFISAVRENSLTGVSISPVTTRQYATTSAPHLLGRTGLMSSTDWAYYKDKGYAMNETVGKDGVEQAFESYLRGTSGTQLVERNANGKIVSQTWLTPPAPGDNITLTIDLPLQQKVEAVLANEAPKLTDEVQGASAVMLDVNSGAVLAMASHPGFDLSTIYTDTAAYNQAAQNPLNPFLNRATQGLYAPGSTFKMVTAAAALEEGVITPTTRILDTGKYTYYKSPQPMCWLYRQSRGTHGPVNVSRALEVSCNVFFYDIGRQVGIEKLGTYAEMFGLGAKTGIEIYEEIGVMAGPDNTESLGQTWYDGNTLSVAIGQENMKFTPLQLANYVATLVNGGTHYAAHLLKSVKSSDYTQVLFQQEPTVLDTINLDPANLDAIKKGMLALTQTGSVSSYFKNLDVQVGAKTGSAQVSRESESNAVFVCFAPYENPQVALAIVVEHGGGGSELGKLAAEILSYYFSTAGSTTAVTPENQLLQ